MTRDIAANPFAERQVLRHLRIPNQPLNLNASSPYTIHPATTEKTSPSLKRTKGRSSLILASTYLTKTWACAPSIVGVVCLNGRVRNGNGGSRRYSYIFAAIRISASIFQLGVFGIGCPVFL